MKKSYKILSKTRASKLLRQNLPNLLSPDFPTQILIDGDKKYLLHKSEELILNNDTALALSLLFIYNIKTCGLHCTKTNISTMVQNIANARYDHVITEINDSSYWNLRAYEELKRGTVFQAIIFLLYSLWLNDGATKA